MARISVRIDLLDAYFDRLGGGLTDSRGRPRASWKLYVSLHHQYRETAKMLGLGPAVRAGVIRDMAGAAVDASSVRAAQERLLAKHSATQ